MTNLLVTEKSFSKMKKRLQSALQPMVKAPVKLSDCATLLAKAFGFEHEHELQAKFKAPVLEKNTGNDDLIAVKLLIETSVFERVKQNNPVSVYTRDTVDFKIAIRAMIPLSKDFSYELPGCSVQEVFVHKDDLIALANWGLAGDSGDFTVYWNTLYIEQKELTQLSKNELTTPNQQKMLKEAVELMNLSEIWRNVAKKDKDFYSKHEEPLISLTKYSGLHTHEMKGIIALTCDPTNKQIAGTQLVSKVIELFKDIVTTKNVPLAIKVLALPSGVRLSYAEYRDLAQEGVITAVLPNM